MNRRLWGIVGVVIAGMVAASIALRSPDEVGKVAASAAPALDALQRSIQMLSWPAIGAIAAGLVVPLGAFVLIRRRRSSSRGGFGEPWRTVIEMGRQGRNPATIAQATGLPQDAVRIILSPVAMEPSFPEGNSFRSQASDRGGQRAGRRSNPYP